MKIKALSVLTTIIVLASCGEERATGAGSFPNISSLALEAVPNIGAVAAQNLKTNRIPQDMVLLAWPDDGYSTTAADWTQAISTSFNVLGTILNGASTAPITSMFAQLSASQSRMADINTNFSDASGNAANCTALTSATAVNVPYWDSATNAAFNAVDTDGKFTCWTETASSGQYLVFGRQAIAAPPAGCTDAYEYFVLETNSSDDSATSTTDAASYGPTQDTFGVGRHYYNGCTEDLKINLSWYSKYSGGAGVTYPDGYVFAGRSELTGNPGTKAFTLRTTFLDRNTDDNGSFTTVIGTGVSRKATAASADASFSIGYKKQEVCSNDGATCTGSTYEESFCVVNASTADAYTQETTAPDTVCVDSKTAFEAMTPLVYGDVPSAHITINATTLGL